MLSSNLTFSEQKNKHLIVLHYFRTLIISKTRHDTENLNIPRESA